MASPGGVEVSRVSVRVVPDTSHLLEELQADLRRIENSIALDVSASVDSAELTASAREAVAEAQAAAGDIDVRANVDTSQLFQAEQALRGATSGANGLLGSFSALGLGAGILSTALIPLTAVVGGLVLALAAPLAVVAGGVTIFGFLAGFAAKDTLEQIKKINELDTKLSGLSQGTQEYADTLAQLKTAQAGLSPTQAAFAGALDKLKEAFSNIPQAALLKPLTDAMLLLADVLPKLTPIIKAVSGVFDDLIGQLGKIVNSPGFKGFVQAFAHDLARDLRAFASIAGNVFIGLGGLFGVLDDSLSKGVLKGLEGITKRFADFGRDAKNNEGLRSFVDYVKQNLPIVGQVVGNFFGLLSKALQSLAPVGSAVLTALAGITGALNDMNAVAGPLAGALAAFGIGSFFGGPEVGLAVGAFVGLAGAFKQVYERSKPLQQIIKQLGDYFEKTWLPKIQNAAQDILPAFKGAIHDISDTIRDNKGLFETLGKALIALGSAALIGAIEQVATAIKLIGKAFKYGTEAVKVWANATIDIFQTVVRGVKVMIDLILTQFGLIVDSAAAAFGWIPHIGGQFTKARDQFHGFTDGINSSLDSVDKNLQSLQDDINAVGQSKPRFTIDSNTLQQIAALHELQRLKIPDKTFKITALIEQTLERTTGPGGAQGRPGDDLSSGNGGGGTGPSRSPVNIDKAFFTDTNDVLRKSSRRVGRRAGGAVLFPPARVADFAGAR